MVVQVTRKKGRDIAQILFDLAFIQKCTGCPLCSRTQPPQDIRGIDTRWKGQIFGEHGEGKESHKGSLDFPLLSIGETLVPAEWRRNTSDAYVLNPPTAHVSQLARDDGVSVNPSKECLNKLALPLLSGWVCIYTIPGAGGGDLPRERRHQTILKNLSLQQPDRVLVNATTPNQGR